MRGRSAAPSVRTIADLCARYRDHARTYYRRSDGSPTKEAADSALSLRELERLYGPTPAARFSLSSLKIVRHAMIEAELCRRVVNQRIGRIRRMFRWAAEEEILPATIYAALRALSDLKRGRSMAVDHPEREAVPRSRVDATLEHLSPIGRAMVTVQLLAGMRPGEVVAMRGADIDRAGSLWLYRPPHHKSAWRGKKREIPIGPKAQRILAPFLVRAPHEPLFSPAESKAWWLAQRRASRRSPRTPFERSRKPKEDPDQKPGSRYTVTSYGRSIEYAAVRAGVTRWTPNQLRHLAATEIERECGLEVACAVLGHERIETTQIYAKGKRARARAFAAERG